MSPDERAIAQLIDRARRRARALLAAESIAWAALAAAGAIAATRAFALTLAPAVVLVALVGLVVAAAVAWPRRRTIDRQAIVRALERAEPSSRNLFVTANELTEGTLATSPLVRARVFAAATTAAANVDLRRTLPSRAAVRALAVACAAWVVAAVAIWLGRSGAAPAPGGARSAPARVSSPAGDSHVTVTIDPPAYTGLPRRTLTDPPQIEAI